jgi:uncharacterized protein
MPRTPREVMELVRQMVAGEGNITFAELFAPDGALRYPFAPPGSPAELRGREAISAFFGANSGRRGMLEMEGVEAVIRETDDPEVVVSEITHHGWSKALGEPYRFTALGVVRIRDGHIVQYDDYMDPIAMARLLGHTKELAAALTA